MITRIALCLAMSTRALFGELFSDKILPHDCVSDEKGIRRTVAELFPDQEYLFYHSAQNALFAAIKDPNDTRILFVRLAGFGESQLVRNGEKISEKFMYPATIRHYGGLVGPKGTVDDRESVHESQLEFWLDYDEADTLLLTVLLERPSMIEFRAEYSPHAGWISEFRQRDKSGEQAGAGQPATRSESGSEGGDKPQPEAEGRSR